MSCSVIAVPSAQEKTPAAKGKERSGRRRSWVGLSLVSPHLSGRCCKRFVHERSVSNFVVTYVAVPRDGGYGGDPLSPRRRPRESARRGSVDWRARRRAQRDPRAGRRSLEPTRGSFAVLERRTGSGGASDVPSGRPFQSLYGSPWAALARQGAIALPPGASGHPQGCHGAPPLA